jgi:hypothetical protein
MTRMKTPKPERNPPRVYLFERRHVAGQVDINVFIKETLN